MKRIIAIAALAALVLTGCAGSRPTPEGTTAATISVDGVDRSYLLTVPDSAGDDAPLVVMLHGGFGSGKQAQSAYGWDEVAASNGFVVAYPDGLGRTWNAGGGCCGSAARSGVDDVGFITVMVDEIARTTSIDTDRVYVTGMSNGAMMSYRLACETSGIFAAIAPVSGTIVGSCDSPDPMAVLHIHGDADDSVHMDGTPGNGAGKVDGMPVPDVIELWRDADGCAPPDVTTDYPVTTSAATCTDGLTVTLITIAGAGHQWPGATPERVAGDEPSAALEATQAIWNFFADN